MKTILSLFFIVAILYTNAQENVFLESSFWSETTSVEDVEKAIKKGNDPTAFNASSFDATANAILADAPLETVRYLLDIKGNEVSKITHDARTYLMWAGAKGNYPLVQYLIDEGSDVHTIDDKGNNILTFTAGGGSLDKRIYNAYVKAGLPLNTPNRKGATVIHYLVQNIRDLEELDFFLSEGMDLRAKDKKNNTIFHYAAAQGNIKLLEQIIEKDFDPRAYNIDKENAAFFAARGKRGHENDITVFKFLAEKGVNMTPENATGNNILHYLARSNKNKEVFEFAIANKVDVEKKNNNNDNPLMMSAVRNNKVAIEILYGMTEDKYAMNKDGYSLMTYALRNKNTSLIQSLQEQEVNYQMVDKMNNNLITHLVATYKADEKAYFEKYFTVLQKKEVSVQPQTLQLATAQENEYLVNYLVNAGVDINAKNDDGITALQLAAMKGDHPEFLKFLISKGADKKVKTEFGESVYELAKNNELLEGKLKFLK